MSTTSTEVPATGPDRFARRQRSWEGVPGVPMPVGPDAPANGHAAVDERELRRTVVGEHLSPKLRGTFFPDAILQTTVLVAVIFAILLILTAVVPPTVGAPADPLNQEHYLPRPAWYFYFLFQILEMMKGPILVPIGTFILPNIALIALLLLPFYDRNRARHLFTLRPFRIKRPLAIIFFYGSMLFILVTTITNLQGAPQQPTKNDQNHAPTNQQGQQSALPSLFDTF